MAAIFPPRLLGAQTIGLYSPSGSVLGDPVEKLRLLDLGEHRLRSLGFNLRPAAHYRGKSHHRSGTPRERADDLADLISDVEVDLILPTIGGHVAAQLLPLLDFEVVADSGKAFFGFSDNAILPMITTALTGAITFHTLCDVTFGFGRFAQGEYRATEDSFLRAVRNGTFELTGDLATVAVGEAEGPLLGGNLNGIVSLLGTRWSPDWRGRLMYWESADPLHRVISQLTHLDNAGVIDQLAGMIVGRVEALGETFYSRNEVLPITSLLADAGQRAGIPILIEADIGHDVENATIPNGAAARITASDQTANITIEGSSR